MYVKYVDESVGKSVLACQGLLIKMLIFYNYIYKHIMGTEEICQFVSFLLNLPNYLQLLHHNVT